MDDSDWYSPFDLGSFRCRDCDELAVIEEDHRDKSRREQVFTANCQCGTSDVTVDFDEYGGLKGVSLGGSLYRE